MNLKDPKPLPRDVFIDTIFAAAKKNKNIIFMSADLGAKALDDFRKEIPEQFIHAGISEQNMVDVAAGLAANGKIVYLYAMAPFMTIRCYEQIKVALAAMSLPATIIGIGSGFSYDDAGPTHYSTEDITCMRCLPGIEVLTPSDTYSVIKTAELSYEKPALRYVRLDRKFLDNVYADGDNRFLTDGFAEVEKGEGMCMISSGLMLGTARKLQAHFKSTGLQLGVIDAYKLKPVDPKALEKILKPYHTLITIEEHFLDGGMGSVILEVLADADIQKKVKRFGLEDRYYFENGGRQHLHRLAGIDFDSLKDKIAAIIKR